jgi:hypothetical protein
MNIINQQKNDFNYIFSCNYKYFKNMNIFFLHYDPKKCAKMHVNKHVIKMITEHVQILCSVHHICKQENPKYQFIPPYKLCHKNHPCNKWARHSLSNYKYLIELTRELCAEYTYRYEKVHKSQQFLDILEKNLPDIPDLGFTPPAQAMPDTYKEKDTVEAYKSYYIFEKHHLFAWKKREEPEFITDFFKIFEK